MSDRSPLSLEEKRRLLRAKMKKKNRTKSYPVSFPQRRLWFLDRLEGSSVTYHERTLLHLKGRISVSVMQRCFDALVARHAALRTAFMVMKDQPRQVVVPAVKAPLGIVDLGFFSRDEAFDLAIKLAEQEALWPFKLERAPLIRYFLFRLDDNEHLLLTTVHHIVADGISLGLLVDEFTRLYPSFIKNAPSPLMPIQMQYPEFVARQEADPSAEARFVKDLSYWREELEGAPPLLELATDFPRPTRASARGKVIHFRVEQPTVDALRKLGRQRRGTLFMSCLAIYNLLMRHHSGQNDLVVGIPMANRNQAETRAMVGFFINSLPVRIRIKAHWSFGELLESVRAKLSEIFTHSSLPFEKLVEEIQPDRATNVSPIFQTSFSLIGAPVQKGALGGMTLQVLDLDRPTAKFDTQLLLMERDGCLLGGFEFATDLFSRATGERFAKHFNSLIHAVIDAPERPISFLSPLSSHERRYLLGEFNHTSREDWSFQAVHHTIERHAHRHPQAIALRHLTEEEVMTYGALNRAADQLAALLRGSALGIEPLIGVCLPRSFQLITALTAVWKAGAGYVPLEPDLPEERLRWIVADSGIGMLITNQAVASSLPSNVLDGIQPVLIDAVDLDSTSFANPISVERPLAAAPAYLLYTSGSTGRPKGVVVPHEGLAHYLAWAVETYDLGRGDGAPLHSPLGFDATVTSLWGPLVAGSAVTIVSPGREIQGLKDLLFGERVFATVKLTPAHLEAIGFHLPKEPQNLQTYSLIIGGDALTQDQLKAWVPFLDGVSVFNEYGPTETVVGCSIHLAADHDGPAIPIGRPIADTKLYVLDAELQPVAQGVVGDLFIGGRGVSRGYAGRPGLTAERFLPDPFIPGGARMYRSGDRVRMNMSGALVYLGRRDFQIKLRGHRIEPAEIETALLGALSLQQAVVLLLSDGDNPRLVAYVVPIGEVGDALDPAIVRELLRTRLPEYMIPSAYVSLPSLPLTHNGKIDRANLAQLAPLSSSLSDDTGRVVPRSPVEEVLTEIWAKVLGLDSAGIHDDFFKMGGHSMLGIAVLSRVRDLFGVNPGISALFEAPTPAAFARRMWQSDRVERQPINTLPRQWQDGRSRFPMSFAQQRLWFLHTLDGGGPAYNMFLPLRLEGDLNIDILTQAFAALVARHESLRTTFAAEDEFLLQIIHQHMPFHLEHIDARSWTPAHIQARIVSEAGRVFDLAEGPLLCATLLTLSSQEHLLLANMHHIISDGVSVGVLVRELAQRYSQLLEGGQDP